MSPAILVNHGKRTPKTDADLSHANMAKTATDFDAKIWQAKVPSLITWFQRRVCLSVFLNGRVPVVLWSHPLKL